MTDNAEAETVASKWTPEDDPDGYTWDDLKNRDWVLEQFLSVTFGLDDETENASVSLTVDFGGTVVSGLAIPRGAWLVRMAELLNGAFSVDNGEGLGDALERNWRRQFDEMTEERHARAEKDLPTVGRGYIHFGDATVYANGAQMRVKQWRGIMSSVTGWSLGEMVRQD